MWLGSPKNMKLLATVSVTVCSSVALLTWLCIFDDTNLVDNDNQDINVNVWNVTVPSPEMGQVKEYIPFAGLELVSPPAINLLKAYGIIAFQFDIHPMLLTIQVDMREKRRIGKAVCYGIVTTCILATITTILAAYRYGIYTTANVLEMLPRSWGLYLVILLVTFQLCLSSAIGNSALFQHIEDYFGAPRDFSFKRCVIRSSLVGASVLIGEILPRFDVVMGLIGGTLTGPLIFILPPLFYTRMLQMEREHDESIARASTPDEETYARVRQAIQKRKYRGYGALLDTIPEGVAFTGGSSYENFKHTLAIIGNVLRSDCLLSIAVILFGLVATFTSTYFNIFDGLDNFDAMWSPCIINITQKLKHHL